MAQARFALTTPAQRLPQLPRRRTSLRHPPRNPGGQVLQAPLRDSLRCHQPDPGSRIPGTPPHPQSRALDDRGDAPHPRLELRRGSHPHRARSGEHDPAAALRYRSHQGARARPRRGHAQFGQEPAPRPRLSENDRQRRPATSARLTAPPGRVRRLVANPRHTGARAVMPR